ncbi:hypothetical protein B0H13DRAFT_2304425 [Mycena leptocephala]|nr:hypothetical protein B0H13DRAFT_2304425 [Mycena leptocephala]
MLTAAALEARSVTLVSTATSGVPASHIQSHSARPDPTHTLHSQKQHKAPVGTIVGVAVAIVAGIAALFFVRWLFVRRARRRAAFSGPGRTLGAPSPRTSTSKGGAYLSSQPQTQTYAHTSPTGMPVPGPAQASERDAVELGQYPPPSSALNPSAAVFPNPTPSASDPSPTRPHPTPPNPNPNQANPKAGPPTSPAAPPSPAPAPPPPRARHTSPPSCAPRRRSSSVAERT